MDGKIFISYRRDDEAFFAEQLYERLKQKYTKERVFYDVDNIPAGRNFVRVLQEQVEKCDVLLAIIGREWLDARDEAGTRRLDKADDFVRIEIESALARSKMVIPVLVGNTRVPKIDALPDPLKPLVHLQAYQFNHGRFIADLKGFESVLDTVLAEIRERKETPSASPEKLEELKELQNWEFIKSSDNPDEFRKHLALYPNGSTARYAKAALEKAAWKALGEDYTMEELQAFRSEFPNGKIAERAAELRDGVFSKFVEAAHTKEGGAALDAALASGKAEAIAAFLNVPEAEERGKSSGTKLSEPEWPEKLMTRRSLIAGGAVVGGGAIVAAGYAYFQAVPAATMILRGHADRVRFATFSPDGTRVATASSDKTARLWDAQSGMMVAALNGHRQSVWSAVFSADGTRLVTASEDSSAWLWDAKNGAVIAALNGHEDRVTSAVFSPDGTRVATASFDMSARLWDATSGARIADLKGHGNAVRSANFSPDGTRVVTAAWDNTARLWDPTNGSQILVLKGHADKVWSAVFSPNGARIVTASDDQTARLWDATNGSQIVVLKGHADKVWSAVFSPDGARIATASDDQTARLWDATSGAQIVVLSGHERTVRYAIFSPDNARVVTASWDKTARLWDANTGVVIDVLRGHESEVNSAFFSPDDTRVVTASADKTARIWQI